MRFLAWLAALVPVLAVGANARPPCDVDYVITPRLDTMPRRLDVEMSFDAESRTRSAVRVQSNFAGVDDYATRLTGWRATGPQQSLAPGELNQWVVQHLPSGRVTIHYEALSALPDPDDDKVQPQEMLYRTHLAGDWFQFFGYGVLPSAESWGDDRKGTMCIEFRGVSAGAPVFSSHGIGSGPMLSLRVQGTHDQLRHAFYGGGTRWRLQTRELASGPVHVAARGIYPMSDADFAEATARLIDVQRRFWGNEAAPAQLVVLTPNHATSDSNGGTLVTRAAVLHVNHSFSTRSGAFQFLIGHENLHQWFPRRFGGMGRDDQAPLRYWFSEGFTDFYAHRLLVNAGMWSLDDYARVLNEKIERHVGSEVRNVDNERVRVDFFRNRAVGRLAYERGEFLALDWHGALRASGKPGMDALLKALMQPPAAADDSEDKRPLAVDRLVSALQAELGERPRKDVARVIDRGESFEFTAGTLGPCFDLRMVSKPRWQLGFDRASFKAMKLSGVEPDGPAWAAGLRDGQVLAGMSVYGGDVGKDALIQIREADGKVRDVVYRPVSRQRIELPVYTPARDALQGADCKAWFGL